MTSRAMITITMSEEQAEAISGGMADLLCWCNGFKAGAADSDRWPMGVERVRDMRLLLKSAIANKREESTE